MTQGIDLKEVRQRAFRSYVQDGLLEIWIGIWFALFLGGIVAGIFFDSSAVWIVLIVIWLISFQQAKKRLTHPRIGQVSVQILSQGVRAGLVVILALIILALVGVLALGFADQARSPIRAMGENLSAVMGLFLAGLFGYMAFRFGITRYYAFAILSLIAGFLVLGINFDPWMAETEIRWAMYAAVMAVVLVPSGLVLLMRFLRENPVLEEEALDGAS